MMQIIPVNPISFFLKRKLLFSWMDVIGMVAKDAEPFQLQIVYSGKIKLKEIAKEIEA
jgi:hypothetical protein